MVRRDYYRFRISPGFRLLGLQTLDGGIQRPFADMVRVAVP